MLSILSVLLVGQGAWAASGEEPTAEEKAKVAAALPDALKGLKIEALGYIEYSSGDKGGAGDTQSSYNQFNLTRGYLTIQKDINSWLSARVTTDITRDSSSSWETRIKYLYVQMKSKDVGTGLTGIKTEFGQGHIPWLDFEEHINPYRCQSPMAIERAGVFNSADLGASIQGNFGPKLKNGDQDAKALTGNSHYDGRWGSWHIGAYNGGGYHASENNTDKVFEGRFSLRPAPTGAPGLQLSYFGVTGEGNVAANAPDYRVDLAMLSYEHPSFTFTGQVFQTDGNSGGSWVDGGGKALATSGNSLFAVYHFPGAFSIFARRDHFDADDDNVIASDATYDLTVAGFGWTVKGSNLVLIDYEWVNYGKDSGGLGKAPSVGKNLGDDNRLQVVFQFSF